MSPASNTVRHFHLHPKSIYLKLVISVFVLRSELEAVTPIGVLS